MTQHDDFELDPYPGRDGAVEELVNYYETLRERLADENGPNARYLEDGTLVSDAGEPDGSITVKWDEVIGAHYFRDEVVRLGHGDYEAGIAWIKSQSPDFGSMYKPGFYELYEDDAGYIQYLKDQGLY